MFKFFLNWNIVVILLVSPWFYFASTVNKTLFGLMIFMVQAIGHFGLLLFGLILFLNLMERMLRDRALGFRLSVYATVSTAILVSLLADLALYWIYRFHFNGLIWWVIQSPEGRATLGIDRYTLLGLCAVVIMLLVLHVMIFTTKSKSQKAASTFIGPAYIFGLILVINICDHVAHAYYDLKGNRLQVYQATAALPGYSKSTIKKWYAKTYGYEALGQTAIVQLSKGRGQVRSFNPQTFQMRPGARKANVVMIVVDSWRADMLQPDIMPQLSEIAKDFDRFNKHYSGGNGTRDGLFSLASGSHSIRWLEALANPEPASIVTLMQSIGARIEIRSATSLEFPEFRRTIFSGLSEDAFYDRPDFEEQAERDIAVVDHFVSSLEREENSHSLRFDFFLLDSAHGPFGFTNKHRIFNPYAKGYLTPSIFSKEDLTPIFNRYKNACHFIDTQVARIVSALKQSGRYESSIIVITGDHGEEFYDSGFWGHASAFTEAQLRVPLLIRWPRTETPSVFEHPTQHVDVTATIHQRLGVAESPSTYTQGVDLYAPVERVLTSCGWDRCSVAKDDARLVFGVGPARFSELEALNRKYQSISTDSPKISELMKYALMLRTHSD